MRTKEENFEYETYLGIKDRIHKNIRYLLDYHGMTMIELANKADIPYKDVVTMTGRDNRSLSFSGLHSISRTLESTVERVILCDMDEEIRKVIESKLLGKQKN